jgi:hypothetical protein
MCRSVRNHVLDLCVDSLRACTVAFYLLEGTEVNHKQMLKPKRMAMPLGEGCVPPVLLKDWCVYGRVENVRLLLCKTQGTLQTYMPRGIPQHQLKHELQA